MLNYTLLPEDTRFSYQGKVAYLTHDARVSNPGHPAKPAPNLPVQDPITTTLVKVPGQEPTFEFDVLPKSSGRANGGLKAKVTFTNLQGVGPGALMGIAVDRSTPRSPSRVGRSGRPSTRTTTRATPTFSPGMQVDANDLLPGRYRVRIIGEGAGLVDVDITFTRGQAWPDPGQKPYDVSNLDFFNDLAEVRAEGPARGRTAQGRRGRQGRPAAVRHRHRRRRRDATRQAASRTARRLRQEGRQPGPHR